MRNTSFTQNHILSTTVVMYASHVPKLSQSGILEIECNWKWASSMHYGQEIYCQGRTHIANMYKHILANLKNRKHANGFLDSSYVCCVVCVSLHVFWQTPANITATTSVRTTTPTAAVPTTVWLGVPWWCKCVCVCACVCMCACLPACVFVCSPIHHIGVLLFSCSRIIANI